MVYDIAEGKLPDDCKNCEHWERVKDRERIQSVLTEVVSKVESRLTANDFKPSLGEYFKGLEILQDMHESEGGEAKSIGWVDILEKSED